MSCAMKRWRDITHAETHAHPHTRVFMSVCIFSHTDTVLTCVREQKDVPLNHGSRGTFGEFCCQTPPPFSIGAQDTILQSVLIQLVQSKPTLAPGLVSDALPRACANKGSQGA